MPTQNRLINTKYLSIMYSMVVIEINNSFSKISNLDSITFNKLRKELSYSIDSKAAYFSGRGYNSLRYCIDMKGVFATGLLHRVYAFCIEKEVKFEVKDIRVRPKSNHGMFKLKG